MKWVPTESMHGMVWYGTIPYREHGMVWYGTIPHREHAWGSSGQTEACQVTIASLLQNSLKYIPIIPISRFRYSKPKLTQVCIFRSMKSARMGGSVVNALWNTTPVSSFILMGRFPNLSPRFLAALLCSAWGHWLTGCHIQIMTQYAWLLRLETLQTFNHSNG